MSPQFISENRDTLIEGFPNTYTFTKNLVEKSLFKFRENVPMVIVRPAIIMSSYKEPYEGWTDTISAGGAILFSTGIGALRVIHMDQTNSLDMIPVDLCSNAIIATTAHSVHNPGFKIYHCASSK